MSKYSQFKIVPTGNSTKDLLIITLFYVEKHPFFLKYINFFKNVKI